MKLSLIINNIITFLENQMESIKKSIMKSIYKNKCIFVYWQQLEIEIKIIIYNT